jgi:hypothetical protein
VKRMALVVVMLAAVVVFVPRQPASAATCRASLKALVLSSASVPGGATDKLTVTLTCAASATVTVHLKGFKGITVPSTLRVARHKSSGTATVRTAVTHAARRGDVEATLGQAHRKAALSITRTPRTCRRPSLTSMSAPSLVYVGDRPSVTIRLSCASTVPIRLALKSSNPDLPVPAKVAVGSYYDMVRLTLVPKASLEGQYKATITASYGSKSLTRTITADPGLASVQIPPTGGDPDAVDFFILFTGPVPAGGLTVKLASDSPAVTLPATYTFTQVGSLGGDFPGITVNQVTKNTPVKLSATLGSRTLSASIVLLPPFDSSDTATLTAENGPGPIYGQESFLQYNVTLSNPAPATGETVTFSASDPSIELETTSTFISPGFTDGSIDIDTADVTSPVHAEIDATVDGVTASLPVTVEPGLDTITGVPATIVGGQQFTGTVSLAGPVDTATTVSLQSTWGILTVPGLVTIPAGQSSVNFTATSVPVTSDSDVQIVASLGTSTIYSSVVDLTPPPPSP